MRGKSPIAKELVLSPAQAAARLPSLSRVHGARNWRLRLEVDRRAIGLFAQLNFALYFIDYAESLGALPEVGLHCENYWDGERYAGLLEQYFEVPWSVARSDLPLIRVRLKALEEIPALAALAAKMTLHRGREILDETLHLNDSIENSVSTLVDQQLLDPYLAVHFRGTDKKKNAVRVAWPEVATFLQEANSRLATPCTTIFVATDEAPFIDHLIQALPDYKIVMQPGVARSTTDAPMHLDATSTLSGMERFELGRQALIDCLLLSRAKLLIRTASVFSGWASVFNPSLPVLMMSTPFRDFCWFPDREVIPVSDGWFATYKLERKGK